MSSIRNKAIAVGLLPLVFLLLVVAIFGVLQAQTDHTSRWIRHSDAVLSQSQDLTNSLMSVERDLQTYLTHPKTASLRPYERQRSIVKAGAAHLRVLVGDNPRQSARAAGVQSLALQILAVLERYRVTYVSGQVARAKRDIARPQVQALSREWYAQTAAFAQAEAQIKNGRWANLGTELRVLDWALGASAAIGLLLTFFTMWRFGMGIARRLEALKLRVQGADGDIPPGSDEIADLGRAYRRMASEIEQRQAQLEKYRLLAMQARDIILFVRRSDGRVLEANAAAEQAYGYTADELAAMTARDLRAPHTLPNLERELDAAEESSVVFESAHRRKDGSEFPVEIAAQGAIVAGERVIVSIVRDITERNRVGAELEMALERALEASVLKSQFVATMSHEIRTPMNAVIGMTELLLESGLSDEQRRCASVVRESGELLLNLINSILDFSKIEASRVDLEVAEFSLLQMIESVAGLFVRTTAEKRLALMTYVDPAIPQTLLGDPGRLRQVIVNLLANAVKFTQRGAVIVSADLQERTEQYASVAFTVKDTGIGIEPSKIETLFEPFRQADGSTTREYGGTGLGLAISRGLVELMGGRIAVMSVPGAGSSFTFAIEFKYRSAANGEASKALEGLRALVVAEDPLSREVFLRYLASWRMRADVARDAFGASSMIARALEERNPYDVAIIDMAAPEMDGLALGRKVRADPSLAKTRLIMVTAYDETGLGRQAISEGFSAYLCKPVRQSQLFDCIANAYPSCVESVQTADDVSPVSGELILVAEDNAVNRDLALRQLRRLGYTAVAVSDGKEAVEQAADGSFSTILMDCQMPIVDGFEATRMIRKAEIRTGRHVRIIAMTANAMAEDREACLAAGMDEYIAKPVTLEALRRMLGHRETRNHVPALRTAALDMRHLSAIFENNIAEIQAFLGSALPSIGRLVDRLRAEHEDQRRLSLAHELRGAAANMGAVEVAHAAAEYERAVRSGDADLGGAEVRLAAAYERAAREADAICAAARVVS